MQFLWHESYRFALLVAGVLLATQPRSDAAEDPVLPGAAANLALVATSSTSFVSGHETIRALNDGFTPAHSDDKSRGAYGNWPRSGMQWVQYDWDQPVTTARIDVYWFDDQRGVRLPQACRLKHWNGEDFVAVDEAGGWGLSANQFNTTTFAAVTTTKLRLEMDSPGTFSTGILEWRVWDTGASPNFAPRVQAGVDRVVMLTGSTYLAGQVRDDGKPQPALRLLWSQQSGPGRVEFTGANAASAAARFSAVGHYVLKLTAEDGQATASDTLAVQVDEPPPAEPLARVQTNRYRLTSPFWSRRAQPIITHWIPHCVQEINDPELREGGIENFVQAGNKLAGRPNTRHIGAPFANAWVYNTLEAMCVAQMLDAAGDEAVAESQAEMRKTIDQWIGNILSAQEPDGYLQTAYTLHGQRRWSNKHDHEGYNAGYFLEAAMAHYLMTGGSDLRLYGAAKRLADCWCANIGAGKRPWYEGHQELEQALVRFAHFVEDREGPEQGRKYVALAKFISDCRKDGEEYDQSHLPVMQQYEAVGHAVRAVYGYSGMLEIAMETGDIDYHSAAKSLWDSIVNRKYYVTGGVGSGETSEGFGKDFSLPNNAYCESCAGCGELFFQHKMQQAYGDAKYADLYEETLYNAILGGLDLEARNFTYTNALDSSGARYPWHVCPCCVGNLPRTLLMLPTWMYSTAADEIYVNLFIGSAVTVEKVAGTSVEMIQETDYPWTGEVSLEVRPAKPATFAVKIRVPNRDTSQLYRHAPPCTGLESVTLNGRPATYTLDKGYAAIRSEWKAGDTIRFSLPLPVQRVTAVPEIVATVGKVALRRGPLVYNIESVDQEIESLLDRTSELGTEWKEDLLDGVVVINGTFTNGSPLVAIPNYARLNRGGRSIVWIKSE